MSTSDTGRASGFQGDLTPQGAWDLLAANGQARLIDVRTAAEWQFVGVCDLSRLKKEPVLIEWQVFPAMKVNAGFVDALKAEVGSGGASAPLIFVCRSGARSTAAAKAVAAAGIGPTYNLAGGFEGDRDSSGHRGSVNGWKAAGLPWVQS